MLKRRNQGGNLDSKATAVIRAMQGIEEEKPALPPVDGVEEVVEEVVVEQEVIKEDVVVEDASLENKPIVEAPIEGSELEKEEPIIEKPVVESPTVSDDLIWSKLSETLGREIKSYDDLKPVEVEVDSEVKQLLDWKKKTGLSLSKWNDFNKDFSKMNDLEVAREIQSQKYPSLTKEELDYKMKSFIFDEDVDEDHLRIEKSIKLKEFSQNGRSSLEQNRLDFVAESQSSSLTTEQVDLIDYANLTKKNQLQAESNGLDYNTKLNSAALNLKGLNLNLGEDVNIEYKISDEDKKSLPDFIAKMPGWQNEDGTTNHANVALDGYKIKNFDALIKAAFEQGKSVNEEGRIKKDNNINLDGVVVPQGQGEESKSNIGEVVSNLRGGNRGANARFRRKG